MTALLLAVLLSQSPDAGASVYDELRASKSCSTPDPKAGMDCDYRLEPSVSVTIQGVAARDKAVVPLVQVMHSDAKAGAYVTVNGRCVMFWRSGAKHGAATVDAKTGEVLPAGAACTR